MLADQSGEKERVVTIAGRGIHDPISKLHHFLHHTVGCCCRSFAHPVGTIRAPLNLNNENFFSTASHT